MMFFMIVVLAVLTGIYTMVGGLLAVVWTESIQTVAPADRRGLHHGRGLLPRRRLVRVGPHAGHSCPSAGPRNRRRRPLQLVHGQLPLDASRPAGDPSKQPWLGILLGYPVIGIWYWCCDQTIVQRVLAARDEKQARLGPLFCAFLKILPVFLFVLPGVMCVAMVQQGSPVFHGEAPEGRADAYTFMVTHMLPLGLKGLVTAAMLAAAMQTCSAALNSTATLFAYDIVKRYRPQTSDHRLVVVGKITTVVGTVLAIISSPIFGQKDTVFQALRNHLLYLAADHRRVSFRRVLEAGLRPGGLPRPGARQRGWASSSSSSICSRHTPAGITSFSGTSGCVGVELNSMFASFYLCVLCGAIIVVASLPLPRAAQGRGPAAGLGRLARAAARRSPRPRAGQLPRAGRRGAGHVRCALCLVPLSTGEGIGGGLAAFRSHNKGEKHENRIDQDFIVAVACSPWCYWRASPLRRPSPSAHERPQRYGSVIGLRAEKLDEYKKLHAAVWPTVAKTIREANIRNYSIYLRKLPDGNYYLFGYFEYVGDDFQADMAKMAADPETKRWWKFTDPCQQPLADRKPGQWWASMEEVFTRINTFPPLPLAGEGQGVADAEALKKMVKAVERWQPKSSSGA